MSADLDRFNTRLNESEAMKEEKSDSQKIMLEFHNAMMRNERNNGREDVYSQIREAFKPDDVFKGRIYFDDAEDFINVLKIRLGKK